MSKALEYAEELESVSNGPFIRGDRLREIGAELRRLHEINAELIKALEANSSALHCFTDFSIYSLPDDKIAYEQIAENEITLAKAKERY